MEGNIIFFCEICGKKRCCNNSRYVRTCFNCCYQNVVCQSEIDCEKIVSGCCGECAEEFFETVL